MAGSVSEMQLLEYEDNPAILPAWSGIGNTSSAAASSATAPSLYDNINNYLSGANNWMQNLDTNINPFNVADNLLVKPVENNPYLIGLDNMIYSMPGVNSIYQAVLGKTSLGLGGTVISNTPSTPANSPTELAKTTGTAAGALLGGVVTGTETAVNSAVTKALSSVLPAGNIPNWNWSLIILAIVAIIIIMVIFK